MQSIGQSGSSLSPIMSASHRSLYERLVSAANRVMTNRTLSQ